jgi:hypothetical protein
MVACCKDAFQQAAMMTAKNYADCDLVGKKLRFVELAANPVGHNN